MSTVLTIGIFIISGVTFFIIKDLITNWNINRNLADMEDIYNYNFDNKRAWQYYHSLSSEQQKVIDELRTIHQQGKEDEQRILRNRNITEVP